jgi:dipeptidyl aminopeptidase/acylaminoacyl peptidase
MYRIGSGKYEERGDDREPYRFEYENLETMSVDGTKGPFTISQNGGAWRAAWSPDSARIAYSDYDDKGIYQLFIIDRDGTNRKRISSFSDPIGEIFKIIWSPNGDKIALVIDLGSNDTKTIVINIGRNTTAMEIEDVSAEWWRDNVSFVAAKIIEQQPYQAEYIVMNTSTNTVNDLKTEECYRINPFGDPSMMGCLTVDNERFIVYDTNTSEAIDYQNFYTIPDIQYWIAAPDSYPGINQCGYTP